MSLFVVALEVNGLIETSLVLVFILCNLLNIDSGFTNANLDRNDVLFYCRLYSLLMGNN